MVERTTGGIEEFKGKVDSVKHETSELPDGSKQEQFHIVIEPLNIEVGGETGKMHEWLPISKKATKTSVPEGSILHKYISELELLDKAVKDIKEVEKALKSMEGKCYQFKPIKHGQAFGGKEAKEYWTPREIVDEAKARSELA